MKDWQRVEAILFGSGKYLTEDQLVQLSGVPKKNLKKALGDLKKYYEQSETSLAVYNENDAWKLNVKEEFATLVKNVISEAEMARAVMETLAIIAYKSPVLQSEVIDMRGSGAYDHISLLEEKEFITKEKFGRSFKLRIAQKFYDYFDMPDSKLRKMFKDAKKPDVVGNLEVYNQDKHRHKTDETATEKEFDDKVLDRMKKLEETPHDEEARSKFLNDFDRKYELAKKNIDTADEEMNEFRRIPADVSTSDVLKTEQATGETDGEKIAKQLEEEIDALESIKASAEDPEDEGKGTEFFAGDEGEEKPRKQTKAKKSSIKSKTEDEEVPAIDPDFRPKKRK
jgi:segregation and condensation protein B